MGVSWAGARRSEKVRPSRAAAPGRRWRGQAGVAPARGARRRDMAAGGRLEDVSEAPSPGPAIPASCAGLRGRRLRAGSYPEPPRPGPEGTLGDGVTSGRGPQSGRLSGWKSEGRGGVGAGVLSVGDSRAARVAASGTGTFT